MKRTVLIIVGIVLLIGGFVFHRWASQPVVSRPDPDVSTTVQGAQVKAPSTLESPYFLTKLHGGLAVRSDNIEPAGPIRQQLVALSSDGRSSDQLAITIGLLTNGGIEEVSAVQFRRVNPDRYQQVEIAGMPVEAKVYRGLGDEYELAVFWPYSDRYAAVVISGLKAKQRELDEQLMTTINNWQWR